MAGRRRIVRRRPVCPETGEHGMLRLGARLSGGGGARLKRGGDPSVRRSVLGGMRRPSVWLRDFAEGGPPPVRLRDCGVPAWPPWTPAGRQWRRSGLRRIGCSGKSRHPGACRPFSVLSLLVAPPVGRRQRAAPACGRRAAGGRKRRGARRRHGPPSSSDDNDSYG